MLLGIKKLGTFFPFSLEVDISIATIVIRNVIVKCITRLVTKKVNDVFNLLNTSLTFLV